MIISNPLTVAIITAIGPVLATIIASIITRMGRKNTEAKIAEVHVIVNQQRSDMMAEIKGLRETVETLKGALTKS